MRLTARGKVVLVSLALAAILALTVATGGLHDPAAPDYGTTQPRFEDEPGWNCHTMGNHICGPGRG